MNNAKNLRSLVALGVLAATISAAQPGSATAQQRRGGGAPGGFADNPGMALWNALDQRFEDFSERLALSDEQVSRTNTLVADFREANESQLARWDRVRNQMRNRMGGARRGGSGGARRGGGAGDPQARQAVQEMRSLVEQLGPAFETLHRDFSLLLSEDQTETLRQLLRRQPRG